jgi:hypothetical protein
LTSGVISAFILWFRAFAYGARAAVSPTFPWWSIFALIDSAHLDFRKASDSVCGGKILLIIYIYVRLT